MPERGRPLLLGHRGARAVKSIPENTFESFDRALSDGCDGFEFDVRLTADGEAVICHDPRFQGFEIAKTAASRFPQLPRLEDVLSRYQEKAFLDIELKVSGLEETIILLLAKCPPRRGFVVSSFLPEVLLVLSSKKPQIPLGLICETSKQLLRWRDLPIQYVMPHHKLVTTSLVSEIKSAGKKIMVWTVNDSTAMKRWHDLGIDGIISDDTSLLRRMLPGSTDH